MRLSWPVWVKGECFLVKQVFLLILAFNFNRLAGQVVRLRRWMREAFQAEYGIDIAKLSGLRLKQMIEIIRLICIIKKIRNSRMTTSGEEAKKPPTHLLGHHSTIWTGEETPSDTITLTDFKYYQCYYGHSPLVPVGDDDEVHYVRTMRLDTDE